MRRGLEYAVSTGKLEGKRGRGRPRETMLGGLASWHGGISVSEMIGCTRDRRLGRHDNPGMDCKMREDDNLIDVQFLPLYCDVCIMSGSLCHTLGNGFSWPAKRHEVETSSLGV
ncbi:hypothetical protein BsWGS_17841 [Bradybaena similaris]